MSVGPIVFPDVTALVVAGLRSGFAAAGVDVPVGARVPGGRAVGAGPLVTVRRNGGVVRDYVMADAVVELEAWDDEPEDAQDLMQSALSIARGFAGGAVDGQAVYRVDEDAGATYTPDEESDQPRYTATVSVTVKGRNP